MAGCRYPFVGKPTLDPTFTNPLVSLTDQATGGPVVAVFERPFVAYPNGDASDFRVFRVGFGTEGATSKSVNGNVITYDNPNWASPAILAAGDWVGAYGTYVDDRGRNMPNWVESIPFP